MVQIVGRSIQDRSFLNLLSSMLKAGYMENWVYHKTHSGTPQGAIVSPILSNIYLHKLDEMIERELIPEWTKGKSRAKNPEHVELEKAMDRAKRRKDTEEIKRLKVERGKLPSGNSQDPNFRRLRYVRYADDCLLGFIGPRKEAVLIKERLRNFIGSELKLEMNEAKTYITQASKRPARFLGYDIQCPTIPDRRAVNGKVLIRVPRSVVTEWVGRYTEKGKPIPKPERLYQSDFEIVAQYGSEFRGLYNYYKYAQNVSRLTRVKYVMMSSLVRTLANKHKTHSKAIYKKYKSRSDTVSIEVKLEEGPIAKFGGFSLKRVKRFTTAINDQTIWTYYGRNELTRRLTKDICEIEGCNQRAVEGHHINALKNLNKAWKGKKNKPDWVRFMIARKRKTIMVCIEHHQQIHNGTYGGPKVVGKH